MKNTNIVIIKTDWYRVSSNSDNSTYRDPRVRNIHAQGQEGTVSNLAFLFLLRARVCKVAKENLKPRKKGRPSVKFLQCNMQKSQHAQIDLNRRIRHMNNAQERFICCIQEPCSTNNKLVCQPNSVQRFGQRVCPRTCIYADKNTESWYMEALSNRDLTVIQTEILKQQVLVASVYLDGTDDKVWNDTLNKVIDYADNKKLGLILCMDSNSHSTLFGPDTNGRGKKLEEALAANNLTVENVGHVPTFHGGNSRTCIDVTLTKNLRTSIKEWKVNTEYNGSDHNTIEFSTDQEHTTIPKIWKWHKADWCKFREKMDQIEYKLPTVISTDVCEDMLKIFYTTLDRALQISVPKTKEKVIDSNNPWWSDEFKQARRNLCKAYKAKNKTPSLAATERYKTKHAEYKKNCNKARLWSWRDLQNNISSISDMNKFRKIVQTTTRVTLGTLHKGNGEYTIPGEDTIDYLSRIHFTKATPLRKTSKTGRFINKRSVLSWDESYLTISKIKEAISGFKSKKSPGTDGIHPLVLQQLPNKALEYLETLYRICLLLGYTPTKWKECKVVFIPKPGKDTYDTAKAWRPISLTNYLLKTLERICTWHMDEKLIDNPVHTRQHGFRNDRNTETSLSNVVNYIPGASKLTGIFRKMSLAPKLNKIQQI